MIKFFRHIRKKLLSENKMGKYFKYAIGEILLVVIGILIALQINTWNQNRLNKKEAKSIIASIHEDLVKDTLLLHNKIKSYENLLEYNQELTNRFRDEKANLDTYKEAVREFNPVFETLKSFNNTTLSSIESTGKIELLNDILKKEILEYKNLQTISLSETNTEIYLGFMHNFTSKYRFGKNRSKYINELNDKIANEQEYVNLASHLLGYKNYMMNSSLASWRQTKEKAKKIISMIEIEGND